MFRRGLVAMTARLLLCVAFVANILVLVACSVKKCPENEEFSFSPDSIQRPQYCSENGDSTYRLTSRKPYKGGCVCKENYLRAENGTCIPAAECPVTCGVNEILDNCPTDCQSDYCPTEEDTEEKPCVKPDVCPPPACKCAFNYRRASNGSCIPTIECPPIACGTNEEYNPCPPLCPTDDCSQASPSGECPPQIGHIGIILPCDPKCRCIKDYWRLDGICVPYAQCPGVCPDNERYSTCREAECRALNCTQKDQSVPCIDIDPQYCTKECVCNEGYLRNDDGICVPEDQCESPVTCGVNEILDNCPTDCQSDYCPTEEDTEEKPCVKLDVCPPPACKCAFNYRRASNGSCIPTIECPPFACGTNEEYNPCPPLCPTDDCSQASPSGECPPQIGRIGIILPCNPKCRCIKDYWRLDGICVPYAQCPGVCPNNERYSTCTETECRALNCTQKDQSVPCIDIDPQYCTKGCVCNEGYLRNDDGICVPEDQCESPVTCGVNEILDNCPTDCQSDYCPTEEDTEEKPCVKLDVCPPPACKCAFNYRRASNGSCIPTIECPPFACGTNEEYNPCPPLCPTDSCSQASPSGECPPQIGHIGIILPCDPKCRCIKDYWRLDGICVPYAQCPGVCSDNERYSTCTETECRALNCTQKDQSVPCIDIDPQYCTKGCVCNEGYLRNDDGICVPEDQCESPVTCGVNEILDNCPTDCQSDYCPTEEDTEEKPCVKPDVCPPPACKCAFNYRRASNGSCIPTIECPPFACGTNEEYNPCPPLCPTDSCSQASPSGECPPQIGHIGIILPCDPKCRCIKDYWRLDGICVPYAQCPGVCPDNERYSTCTETECRALNCTQKDQSVPCIDIDPQYCTKGCVCNEGYLRNDDGICVPEDQCESPVTCGVNEILDNCPTDCQSDYCPTEEDTEEKPCVKLDVCPPPACKCAFNYRRASNGSCIPTIECPPFACGTNEEHNPCPPLCPTDDCSQASPSGKCPLFGNIGIILPCNPKCRCIKDYWRLDGICVPYGQCPGVCPDNERYSTCIQAECRALNCSQKGQQVPCIRLDPMYCEKGCVCEEGYLRNEDGICVLEDKCEPAPSCTSANEEFVPCIQGVCRAKDCSQKGEDVPCPDIPQEQCESGCICKEHFLRAANGSCVPEDQCEPNKCPLFEVWDDCANAACRAQYCIQKGMSLPCTLVTECLPGCLCRPDYLRNADGFCVPEVECNTNVCPINEEWSTCAQATCRAQYCSQKGEPIFCPMIAEGYCEEACVCKENYLRNENGDCVPEDQCPPKPCGENEFLDYCPLSCNSDNCPKSADEEQVCIQSDPCIPACKCKFNYKRSENGTCIPTRDCPPFDCSAKPNEEFVACPPICPTDECGKPRLEGRCPYKIGTFLQCNPKCQCNDGYGRLNGTCVPFEQCPDLCPANEVYSSCVQQICRQQNCADRDVAMETCPSGDEASCQRGCVCQENYYRNDKGVCVPYEECEAPKRCGENEVLENCPMTCNYDNCPKSADEEKVCTQPDPCIPACKCRFNYRRAENGTCIPTRDCPPFDCSAKPNEEFVACPPLCPTDECGMPRLEGRCPYRIGIILYCNPKCQCKDGYGRVNGTCVPFEQCPDLCPTNEVYSSCVQQTCRQQKCSDRDLVMETSPSYDEASCQRGCVCQENYYRNDKGVCVSYEECGGPMCPNAHEE